MDERTALGWVQNMCVALGHEEKEAFMQYRDGEWSVGVTFRISGKGPSLPMACENFYEAVLSSVNGCIARGREALRGYESTARAVEGVKRPT